MIETPGTDMGQNSAMIAARKICARANGRKIMPPLFEPMGRRIANISSERRIDIDGSIAHELESIADIIAALYRKGIASKIV
jgi:hypothetical protein